jgi:hypothetical protein
MKPIEETVATLALGFAIGVMGVIAGDKLVEDEIVIADKEHTRADELISIYKAWHERRTTHQPGGL